MDQKDTAMHVNITPQKNKFECQNVMNKDGALQKGLCSIL